MIQKLLQRGLVITVLCFLAGSSLPSYAETSLATVPQGVEGFSMMGWLNSQGIVEQLQTIHRFSRSTSPSAIMGLVSALNSPFPLARRKASHSLVIKAKSVPEDERKALAETLQPALESADPVVQKNLIRLMADMDVPESQASLQQFFRDSSRQEQLDAIDALSQGSEAHEDALKMAIKLSPYPEVRQIAEGKLK